MKHIIILTGLLMLTACMTSKEEARAKAESEWWCKYYNKCDENMSCALYNNCGE